MSQAMIVNLPDPIYQQIKSRAEQTQRTVEAELLEIVSSVSSEEERLPEDLNNAITALSLLDDKTLWQAARTHLPVKTVTRMEGLHAKRGDERLTQIEEQELRQLVKDYEKSILIRSEAMGILMERGYDISKLIKSKKA